jgi:hypothetical protein
MLTPYAVLQQLGCTTVLLHEQLPTHDGMLQTSTGAPSSSAAARICSAAAMAIA